MFSIFCQILLLAVVTANTEQALPKNASTNASKVDAAVAGVVQAATLEAAQSTEVAKVHANVSSNIKEPTTTLAPASAATEGLAEPATPQKKLAESTQVDKVASDKTDNHKEEADEGDGKELPREEKKSEEDESAEKGEGLPEFEVQHITLQLEHKEPNASSLTGLVLVASLLSFGGIVIYLIVFMLNIFHRKKKSQSNWRKAVGKAVPTQQSHQSEDLDFDFEDLETALNTPLPSPSPGVRKMVQSQVEKEALSSFGWDNDLLSDAGWGDDSWGDDLEDCEVPAIQIDGLDGDLADIAISACMSKPLAPVKGKAD